MMIHSLSNYLQRFDIVEPPTLEAYEEACAPPQVEPAEPSFSLAEVEAIRRDLEADFARRLRAQHDAHEERLLRMREEWTRAESELLGQRFHQALETAFAALRAEVARVLTPFLGAALQERALDELTRAVRQALGDRRDPVLRVMGRADLIDKVATTLGAEAAVNLVEAPDVDVSVDLSPLRMETRLAEWIERLEGDARK